MKDYAASGAFATAVKAIEASEYADLRAWSSLPANIFMQSLKLGDGTYTAEIVRNEKRYIPIRLPSEREPPSCWISIFRQRNKFLIPPLSLRRKGRFQKGLTDEKNIFFHGRRLQSDIGLLRH